MSLLRLKPFNGFPSPSKSQSPWKSSYHPTSVSVLASHIIPPPPPLSCSSSDKPGSPHLSVHMFLHLFPVSIQLSPYQQGLPFCPISNCNPLALSLLCYSRAVSTFNILLCAVYLLIWFTVYMSPFEHKLHEDRGFYFIHCCVPWLYNSPWHIVGAQYTLVEWVNDLSVCYCTGIFQGCAD